MSNNNSDSTGSTSWAALVVAAFAMIIAVGQVAQQYASSGQLIRLCDSVVYGGKFGLPGKGRRVWTWTQFRFRVLYEIPVFGLPVTKGPLWKTQPITSASLNRNGEETYVTLSQNSDIVKHNQEYWAALSSTHQVGEASWASFCRKVKDPCTDRVLITLRSGDADRCPQDLPNVPVPIRLRDIVIMSFAIGLDCVEASLTSKSLSMQGAAGSLTSSNHPILGPLIHFAPQRQRLTDVQPKFWSNWAARLYGRIPVADDILAIHGRRGCTFYERKDLLLIKLRRMSQCSPGKIPNIRTAEKIAFKAQSPKIAVSDDITQPYAKESTTEKPFRDDHDLPAIFNTETISLDGENNPPFSNTDFEEDLKINWYWLSQMNVHEGHFASPWKDTFEHPVCVRAFNVVVITLTSHPDVGLDLIRLTSVNIMASFNDGLPFVTYPPYVRTLPGVPTAPSKSVRDSSWKIFPSFAVQLPLIMISADLRYPTEMAVAEMDFDSVTDNSLFVMELMRIDYWLCRACETEAISHGPSNLRKNTPALVEYMVGSFYAAFRELYITGSGARQCSQDIRVRADKLGLTSAETIFLLVAILRTLRYAFCLGCGLNSKPTLGILTKDLPAHIV